MTRIIAIAAFVVLAADAGSGPAQDAAAVERALATLQGTWNIVTVNGQLLTEVPQTGSLTFKGDTYAQTMNGQVVERGTIKLDPSKKPMFIDIRTTIGHAAGSTQIGLVQIVGDTMTLKTNTYATPMRPTDFKPQEWYVLIVAKRAK